MDNQLMRDLIFRTRIRREPAVSPHDGDTKYGTIENIKALEDAGMRAYVPLPNWEERYEVWSASHFRYEPQADQYRCPQGQMLQQVGEINPNGRQLYRAPASICNACPVKVQCTTSTQGRRVYRHVGEEYVERVRTYQQTPAYQKALRKRQVWVEPMFAEARVLAWSAPLPPAAARAASIVKPYALLLGKISSDCSRNGDGDGVRSQSRPSRPSFWLVTGGLFILCWDLCLLLHVFAHLPS